MTKKCKESDEKVSESRRKPNGYITQQMIDQAKMELIMAEAELDKLSNCQELSTSALRGAYELKSRLINARLILINASMNGK